MPPHLRPRSKETPRQALQTRLPTDAPKRAQRHRPRQLSHYHSRLVTGTLNRSPVRVKPVATAGRTLHLDYAVQHHPCGHQRSQRTPAPNLFQLPGTGFTRQRPRDRRLAEFAPNSAIVSAPSANRNHPHRQHRGRCPKRNKSDRLLKFSASTAHRSFPCRTPS